LTTDHFFDFARRAANRKTTQAMEVMSRRVIAHRDLKTRRRETGFSRLLGLLHRYLRVEGRLALIDETSSTPAFLQIGCEKSACGLGTATMPW
jgi:hypothetical protein